MTGFVRILLVCIALLLLACEPKPPQQAQQEDVVKIGVLYDSVIYSAELMREALQVATDEINARGGIRYHDRGYQLQLVELDSWGKPTLAADNARQLIYKHKVQALIGPNLSRTAIAVANVAENAGVVMITPGSSHPSTTRHHDHVFRMTFIDPVQSALMAKFVAQELGVRKVAVIYDEVNPSTAIVARSFIKKLQRRTNIEVFDLPYVNSTALLPKHERAADAERHLAEQWQELARLALRYGVDAVYLPSTTEEVIATVDILQELGYQGVLLGSDNWSPSQIVKAKQFAGAYFTHHYFIADQPSISEALKKQLKISAAHELSNSFGVLAVDALNLLVETIEDVGFEQGLMRSYIANQKDFRGLSGTVNFDSDGNNRIYPKILTVENNTLRQVRMSSND